MKKYTAKITHPKTGAILSIEAYADAMPKPFRIYYNGRDTGRRYEYIGNAARYLEKVARDWFTDEKETGNAKTIPVKGSNINIKMFLYWYANGEFPYKKGAKI